jgi:hypothetical protein
MGYFYSVVNGEKYSVITEKEFKEVLRDWGFFGPANRQPSWMVQEF